MIKGVMAENYSACPSRMLWIRVWSAVYL